MAHNYILIGIVVLALASTIFDYPILKVVAAPSRPPIIAPVVEAELHRHPVIAAIPPRATKAPLASVSITVNGTAQCPTWATCPRKPSSLQQQSKWGPGVIENAVFGIVAVILGTTTIGVTYFLHVRRPQTHQPASDVWTSDDPFVGDRIPLQDLPPPYDSTLDSPGSVNRDAI